MLPLCCCCTVVVLLSLYAYAESGSSWSSLSPTFARTASPTQPASPPHFTRCLHPRMDGCVRTQASGRPHTWYLAWCVYCSKMWPHRRYLPCSLFLRTQKCASPLPSALLAHTRKHARIWTRAHACICTRTHARALARSHARTHARTHAEVFVATPQRACAHQRSRAGAPRPEASEHSDRYGQGGSDPKLLLQHAYATIANVQAPKIADLGTALSILFIAAFRMVDVFTYPICRSSRSPIWAPPRAYYLLQLSEWLTCSHNLRAGPQDRRLGHCLERTARRLHTHGDATRAWAWR